MERPTGAGCGSSSASRTLTPIAPSQCELVAGWLAAKDVSQWLDFGGGQQTLTAAALAFMIRSDRHVLRLFGPGGAGEPIGVVGLSQIARAFGTATLWYVLGNQAYARQGHTSRAVSGLLQAAFGELGLHAIHAWAVEENLASIRILERLGFRLIGRQRRCHRIDGRALDRLHFDLLKEDLQAWSPA